ncbi:hypothetical protein [Glycomyces buryatensis]|uniref:PQQ-binding-like beta-propeller repeat protein n=1 Tax=Glycomyces buryatensis TaxID=2570927 RepID=A0A4S8QAG1_9ACTN|nr:hypothetical protein [Glycomyces buryatensis]THV41437.1 hypothetical protein FAB82_11605 [Glycomyces buryatensis]
MSESPSRPGALRTEYRRWPRPVRVLCTVVVTALLLSPAAAFTWSKLDSNVDSEDWPEGSIAELAQFSDQAWALGAAPELPYFDGDPERSLTDETYGDEYVWFSDDRVISATYGGLTWESLSEESAFAPPLFEVVSEKVLDVTEVGDALVVVAEDTDAPGSYEQHQVYAVNTVSGAKLWHYDQVNHHALYKDAVVVSRCETFDGGKVGPCDMTAADIAVDTENEADAERWTIEAGTDAGPLAPGGPDRPLGEQLPVRSLVDGEPRLSVMDTESGEQVGDAAEFDAAWAAIEGDSMIAAGAADPEPSDGCRSPVAEFAIGDAEPAWEALTATRPTIDQYECGTLPMAEPVGGRLAADIDGFPAVVETATDESVWTGTEAAQVLGFNDDIVVTAAWGLGGDNLTATGRATGEAEWQSTVPINPTDTVKVVGRTMWVLTAPDEYTLEREASVIDLDTGDAYRFPAQHLTFTGDEVWARFSHYDAEDADRVDGLYIWPSDLWR